MQALFLVLHVLVGIGLITLILLQHGKGADAGAAFGSGASATVFGARGSATFLTKATAVLALLFFSNSFFLNYLSANTTAPKSVIEEQKESTLPTGIIESTVTPIEKEAGKEAGKEVGAPPVAPESDLPALPGESGSGTAGSDVPPVSPGSQASDLPSPEAPGPSLSEPQGAAPIAKTPAADTPKDLPSAGERAPETTPKPTAADQGPPPAEPGPAAAPGPETPAEAAAEKPAEPPSAATQKDEPTVPAKPQATAPKAPTKNTQAATKPAPPSKAAPSQKSTAGKSTPGKSTSSARKKEEKATP